MWQRHHVRHTGVPSAIIKMAQALVEAALEMSKHKNLYIVYCRRSSFQVTRAGDIIIANGMMAVGGSFVTAKR